MCSRRQARIEIGQPRRKQKCLGSAHDPGPIATRWTLAPGPAPRLSARAMDRPSSTGRDIDRRQMSCLDCVAAASYRHIVGYGHVGGLKRVGLKNTHGRYHALGGRSLMRRYRRFRSPARNLLESADHGKNSVDLRARRSHEQRISRLARSESDLMQDPGWGRALVLRR